MKVAGRHFERFLGKSVCRIKDVTATQIADFLCFLQKLGLKTNSVNSYMSSLRAIYNAALSEGLVTVRENPFARLRLKREETAKRAIPSEAIREIAAQDLRERPDLERAADLSIFSFMAFGMPFVDIVNLRKENIRGGEIVYNRRKTGTQIRIEITSGMKALIRKYRNDTPFIFDLGLTSRIPVIKNTNGCEPAEPGLEGNRRAAGAEDQAHLLRHASHMGLGGLGAPRPGCRD